MAGGANKRSRCLGGLPVVSLPFCLFVGVVRISGERGRASLKPPSFSFYKKKEKRQLCVGTTDGIHTCINSLVETQLFLERILNTSAVSLTNLFRVDTFLQAA